MIIHAYFSNAKEIDPSKLFKTLHYNHIETNADVLSDFALVLSVLFNQVQGLDPDQDGTVS